MDYRILGNIERAIAQAFLDVDENVGKFAAIGNYILGLVRALAGGVLAHVNFGRLRGRAFQLYTAAHAGCGCGSIGAEAGAGLASEVGEEVCSSLVFSFLLQPASIHRPRMQRLNIANQVFIRFMISTFRIG